MTYGQGQGEKCPAKDSRDDNMIRSLGGRIHEPHREARGKFFHKK
jgi:hypothetical protein